MYVNAHTVYETPIQTGRAMQVLSEYVRSDLYLTQFLLHMCVILTLRVYELV